MSGLAYFFKPKITASGADSTSSTATSERRSGRRSKARKTSESLDRPVTTVDSVETVEEKPVEQVTEETESLPKPISTLKVKLKIRSQSVQDTFNEPIMPTVYIEKQGSDDHDGHDHDEESSDMDTRLKIDDPESSNQMDYDQPVLPPVSLIISPLKKKSSSSRKKVLTHLIGSSTNTLTLDEPSPIKITPGESQFTEVKQTKSGRTIKYTPYFKELVQGTSISPPTSPSHSTSPTKRSSNHGKKRQSSIKADLDAIKSGSLTGSSPSKGKKTTSTSPKVKKTTVTPTKRLSQGKKSPVAIAPVKIKVKQLVPPPTVEPEQLESDDENDENQLHSDDEDFRQEGHSSEEEDEDDELDGEDDHSSGIPSDEEEWTHNGSKSDHDRSLNLTAALGSISSEMLDGYSLWAMKYRTRHRAIALDDKRLYRTWKKMSAHDRQRWCLKAEKENFHYPITAELLKATTEPSASTTSKSNKSAGPKRKKPNDDHQPILLQKTLNQYSKQQPSLSAIRPPTAFVKQSIPSLNTSVTTTTAPKNYDIVDIAAGIYLLGESLTKMGEKVRQLGHLNPRGASAATSIDNLSAIIFDGTICACNLIACLGNEIVSTNSSSTRSDPLTNRLMENVGIILPGLS